MFFKKETIFLEYPITIYSNKTNRSFVLSYCVFGEYYSKVMLKNILYNSRIAEKYLPEFCLRLYLHESVYLSKDPLIISTLDQIICLKNVEICYVFGLEERFTISRFFPFFDKDVELCISKEMDSLECHNILLFRDSEEKVYSIDGIQIKNSGEEYHKAVVYVNIGDLNLKHLLEWHDFETNSRKKSILSLKPKKYYSEKYNYIFYSYAIWLTLYKLLISHRTRLGVEDIMAGLIGFKKGIFTMNNFSDNLITVKKKIEAFKCRKHVKKYLREIFHTGFDEIFLLEKQPDLPQFFRINGTYQISDLLNPVYSKKRAYQILEFDGRRANPYYLTNRQYKRCKK